MHRLTLALLFSGTFAFGLTAQQVYEPTYEKVLIPLPTGETAGAFGSLWRTTLAVSNISDTPVDVQAMAPAARTASRAAPLRSRRKERSTLLRFPSRMSSRRSSS
jgi:hypothetical protein